MKSFFSSRPVDYYLLWIAIIVSLGINVYLIDVLTEARDQVGLAARSAADSIGELRTSSIDYPVTIRESLPISLTVDYQEDIQVPISLTVPINTQVTVPLRTPIGVFPITVPVNTSIPISLTTVVPLDVAIPISMSVPVNLDVPIHIELADTPMGEALSGVELYLLQVSADLGDGSLPPPLFSPLEAPSPTP